MVLRKHQTSIRKYPNGACDRTHGPPDPNLFAGGENDKRFLKYKAIDEDGICCVGEKLENNDVMVNKESPTDTSTNLGAFGLGGTAPGATSNVEYKSSSISYRGAAESYVDKVLITSNENEQHLIKIMLRQVRRPEVSVEVSKHMIEFSNAA